MNIYIDNKNIKDHYGIDVLDYRAALGFAGERENERVWHDKSGVDRDLFNNRYDAREFVLELSTQAATEGAAHTKIAALIDYIFSKGVFVLSLRNKTIANTYLYTGNFIYENLLIEGSAFVFDSCTWIGDNGINNTVLWANVSGNFTGYTMSDGRIGNVFTTGRVYGYNKSLGVWEQCADSCFADPSLIYSLVDGSQDLKPAIFLDINNVYGGGIQETLVQNTLIIDPSTYRKALLCERSGVITGNGINIREQNSIYTFTLGLKDVNPNAVTYYNTVVAGLTSIIYDKGQNAYIYWGDGTQAIVSNSQTYYKSGYAEDGDIDIIIDVDKDATAVTSLDAQFSANIVNGAKDLDVQFTDASAGAIVIWAWDFGDGFTSAEQSPQHTYTVEGTYTVTLQVFNAAQGSNTETKAAYITVTNSQLLINGTDAFLVNATDILLRNG